MRALALVLLLFLGGGGLYGGILMLGDTSGGSLGLTMELLPDWYSSDYRWPGLLLVSAFGIVPLVTAGLVVARHRWAWALVAAVGTFVLGWMVAQVLMIGLSRPPVQVMITLIGALLVSVGGWERVREAHRANSAPA
ncbi:hypothetical protein IPV09_07745 [Tessaracoccus sp. SD287]|uniref:hypothetical protein n=1 Tax=Tessaracoccus sp. SD287 TaxID=2782008 RepID=UPI001A96FD02|nr:hypothetical protein [Tessaracoccus sp. SD287]MBO1031229.1 hypothetical protein [Tessaracoccus sp. SD287]